MNYKQNSDCVAKAPEDAAKELRKAQFLCRATRWNAALYTFDGGECPTLMREVWRLRTQAFNDVGVAMDDVARVELGDVNGSFRQLILWDCEAERIVGGYRYAVGREAAVSALSLSRYYEASERFVEEFLPDGLELSRTFVSPDYQRNAGMRSLYALDSLWEGLARVVEQSDVRHLFGRVTLYPSLGVRARNLIVGFMRYAFPPRGELMWARHPFRCGIGRRNYERIFVGDTVAENYKILLRSVREMGQNVPPIISSYMRLSPSMRVFESYRNYDLGGVVESAIMLSVDEFYEEIKRRYMKK